jgi:putative nucleotidyltransferase with HDIG domain
MSLFAGTSARVSGGRPRIKPLGWIFSIDLCLAPVALAAALAGSTWWPAYLLTIPLLILTRLFAHERAERLTHVLELSAAYRGTAFLLGDVVEADDAYTGAHSRAVVDLTLRVADELGLDDRSTHLAELTALLHDVGKIKIPASIINKAGALSPEERAIINQHTIEGERLLSQVGGLLGEVGRIVRSCHERWDGGGYPDGLAGTHIPLVARIVGCCDAFNAMTTTRPYREATSIADARTEIERNRGLQFDPHVVDALLRVTA